MGGQCLEGLGHEVVVGTRTSLRGTRGNDATSSRSPVARQSASSARGCGFAGVRTATCASVPRPTGDATSAIQTALNGCAGKNQVVALAPGTYSTSATLTVPSGVVLRGAGSDAASGTTILLTN